MFKVCHVVFGLFQGFSTLFFYVVLVVGCFGLL